jgi:hypothetical protein
MRPESWFMMEEELFQRPYPYLVKTDTLDLITVQNRAWNDIIIGCLVWIDLQLAPFKVSSLPFCFIGVISSIDANLSR